MRGLEMNGLLTQDYLLTGYLGTPSFVLASLRAIDTVKAANPATVYCT